MELLIQVQDNDAPFLMELLQKFDFVTIKMPSNSVLDSLELSLHQMHEMKEGKLAKPNVSELFVDVN